MSTVARGGGEVEETKENATLRDIYNHLRTKDDGIGCDTFLKSFYFLQTSFFSILDVKESFECSLMPDEKYLNYRDFQFALQKIARTRYFSQEKQDEYMIQALLLKDLYMDLQKEEVTSRWDRIRTEMIKHSVLNVLEVHLPKLTQSFQIYGQSTHSGINSQFSSKVQESPRTTIRTITVEGFVDFLNAYFEYEDFISYHELLHMVEETKDDFPILLEPQIHEEELYFPHFIELFCRVAVAFHIKTLQNEGAQLRKAIESSKLEFSIQLLMEHMKIKLLRLQQSQPPTSSSQEQQQQEQQNPSLLLDDHDTPSLTNSFLQGRRNQMEAAADGMAASVNERKMEAILKDIEHELTDLDIHGNSGEGVNSFKNKPRKMSSFSTSSNISIRPEPATASSATAIRKVTVEVPQVTLIREILAPPPLPKPVIKVLESVLSYQNAGQCHMALGALDECKSLFKEYKDKREDDTEVQLYFALMNGSILDTARKDLQAMEAYTEALKISSMLSSKHPGKTLAKGCLACLLYYNGELELARKCYAFALEERMKTNGPEDVDTAVMMNNFACCLSFLGQVEDATLYFRHAFRLFKLQYGLSHPRTSLIARNYQEIQPCQTRMIEDASNVFERGEFGTIIPGSRFQIQALVKNISSADGIKKKKKKKNTTTKKKK